MDENIDELSIFRSERLGTGRFGTVFPGKIKNVTEEIAFKRMEKKKVRVVSSLYIKANECLNIVNYYGTHESKDDEFVYLAIEYCMGTLDDLVCGGYEDFAMTDESHLPIIRQITAGLNQLHSLGIVHGDLKPSNILVSFPEGDTNEPMMKLADFGIHHAVQDEAIEQITQFRLITTKGWMCPADTQDPISPSFDLFSLGCICGFIFLNGLHPFGTDPISGIQNRQPIRLNLGQDVTCRVLTPALLDLIARMLSFDSEKRPLASDICNHPIFNQHRLSAVVAQQLHVNHQMPELVPIIPLPPTSKIHRSNNTGTPAAPHRAPDSFIVDSSLLENEIRSQLRQKKFAVKSREELCDSDYVSETNSDLIYLPPIKKKRNRWLFKQFNPSAKSWQAVDPLEVEDKNNTHSTFERKGEIVIRLTAGKSQVVNHGTTSSSSSLSAHIQQPPLPSSSSVESDNVRPPRPSSSTDERIEKNYNCDICGYGCDSRANFSYHLNSHTKEKPFKCKDCSKSFSRPNTLHHHRKIHKPPSFKCDFCPKMFRLKWDRELHMNTHTGAKPFECELCAGRFTSPSALSQHRKNNHLPPKFECPFCHKMFTDASNCQKHWYGDKSRQAIACKVRRQLISD